MFGLLGKRDTIVFRFLISYILILGIPYLALFLIYFQTVDMVERDVKTSNLSMLEQGRDILDKHLQEAGTMVARVAQNPKVISLTYMNRIGEGSKDIDSLIDAANDLSTYRLTNDFIKEFYIYFNKSDIIITSSAANTRMRLLYGKYFKFADMSYQQWISDIAGPLQKARYVPSTRVTFSGREIPVITYLQTIPLEYPNINRGCVMVFIKADAVNEILQKINIGSDGYTYVLDKDNNIITSICPNGENVKIPGELLSGAGGVMNSDISGKDMVVSYTTSAFNGWKYITLVPTDFVMTKVHYLQRTIFIASVFILLTGFILSLFLTYKNAKPIRDISNSLRALLGDNNRYKNEFIFLNSGISRLVSSNESLGEKLKSQQPVIQADFLKRLFHGYFSDPEEINANLAHLGIRLDGTGFVVVVLKILGYRNFINRNILKELDIARVVINQSIYDLSEGRAVSCDLDEASIAILLPLDNDEAAIIKADTEQWVEKLSGELLAQKNIHTSCAAGSICTSLIDVGFSYSHAIRASEGNTRIMHKKLVWYDETPEHTERYNYSVSMEKRMIDLVASGESCELKKLLGIIRKENFLERKLPFNVLKLLIFQLRGTVIRIFDQTGGNAPDDIFDEIRHAEDAESMFQNVCSCLQELCDSNNAKRSSSDDLLEGKITVYLNTVYMREDLTLHCVASHFGLSETYLYHFFKEKKKITFASYLEKLRMDNAYALLTETSCTISDIARKVGYGSVHSFRRAFKRCKGTIPSELRNA